MEMPEVDYSFIQDDQLDMGKLFMRSYAEAELFLVYPF